VTVTKVTTNAEKMQDFENLLEMPKEFEIGKKDHRLKQFGVLEFKEFHPTAKNHPSSNQIFRTNSLLQYNSGIT
jgi:hypothetical protein